MFICPLGDCVSNENNAYVGLTPTTLSRRLTMHLNDSSSIDLHLKTRSIPKSRFWKILIENTTIIAHEINKLRLQILEDLHMKTKQKKTKINRINFENSDNVLKCFWFLVFFCLPRPADKHKRIKLHTRCRTIISGYGRNWLSPFSF